MPALSLQQLYRNPREHQFPLGVTPVSAWGRRNLVNYVYQGNTSVLLTCAETAEGERATPENSRLTFVLVDDNYCNEPIFTAEWRDNIELTEVGVRITIPHTVTEVLRAGGFNYSLTVSDLLGANRLTIENGHIMIVYGPDAPNPDVT